MLKFSRAVCWHCGTVERSTLFSHGGMQILTARLQHLPQTASHYSNAHSVGLVNSILVIIYCSLHAGRIPSVMRVLREQRGRSDTYVFAPEQGAARSRGFQIGHVRLWIATGAYVDRSPLEARSRQIHETAAFKAISSCNINIFCVLSSCQIPSYSPAGLSRSALAACPSHQILG